MPIGGEKLQDRARDTALVLPGVSHARPFTEQLDVYEVAGKAFLIVTDDPGRTHRHPQGRTEVRAAAATRGAGYEGSVGRPGVIDGRPPEGAWRADVLASGRPTTRTHLLCEGSANVSRANRAPRP